MRFEGPDGLDETVEDEPIDSGNPDFPFYRGYHCLQDPPEGQYTITITHPCLITEVIEVDVVQCESQSLNVDMEPSWTTLDYSDNYGSATLTRLSTSCAWAGEYLYNSACAAECVTCRDPYVGTNVIAWGHKLTGVPLRVYVNVGINIFGRRLLVGATRRVRGRISGLNPVYCTGIVPYICAKAADTDCPGSSPETPPPFWFQENHLQNLFGDCGTTSFSASYDLLLPTECWWPALGYYGSIDDCEFHSDFTVTLS